MRLRLLSVLIALCSMMSLAACGDSAPTAQTNVAVPPADPAIMALYNRSCISCHAGGAGGAPRTGDVAAWQPRLEQGIDVLLDHTISGYKGMPPMGMCMDCDEDQFTALLEYMAGQSLK